MVIFDWSVHVYTAHTSMVYLFGYVVPAVLNGFEFTLRTIKEYRRDMQERAEAVPGSGNYYVPTLKLGHVVARFLGVFTPVINVIVAIANLDRVFEWIGNVFRWFGRILDIPLVPKR